MLTTFLGILTDNKGLLWNEGGKWHIAGNCYDEKDRHSEQVVGACREVVEKSSEDEYH